VTRGRVTTNGVCSPLLGAPRKAGSNAAVLIDRQQPESCQRTLSRSVAALKGPCPLPFASAAMPRSCSSSGRQQGMPWLIKHA
jgi:hypothetical protein